jgi:hypothetical protein
VAVKDGTVVLPIVTAVTVVFFFFATKLNIREQLVAETVRRRRDRFYIVREMR